MKETNKKPNGLIVGKLKHIDALSLDKEERALLRENVKEEVEKYKSKVDKKYHDYHEFSIMVE